MIRPASGDFSLGSDVWPGTAKAMEEMGELLQVMGKLIAIGGETKHWDGTDLLERLHEEIADVAAALFVFVELNGINAIQRDKIEQRMRAKIDRLLLWHREHATPRGGQ